MTIIVIFVYRYVFMVKTVSCVYINKSSDRGEDNQVDITKYIPYIETENIFME